MNSKGCVIWLTGLSGAGKTTIANNLKNELNNNSIYSIILDGDTIRNGLNSDLDFSEEDRIENIRRASEIAKILCDNGLTTICCFISPTNNLRNLAKNIIGKHNFYEIFVNASIEECIKRDVKGLYKKSLNGELINFSGINSLFEIPENPFLILNTESESENESLKKIMEKINFLFNKNN